MTDTEMDNVGTPTRKRPYRGSMQDGSMEHSAIELEDLMTDKQISPSTRKIMETMSGDINFLRNMDSTTVDYVAKQCELLRTEKILGDIFAKDERFKKLSFSYENMVDQGRILNFGDYHKGNLFVLKSVAREHIKDINTRKKDEKIPNLLEGKPWKEIIEAIEKEKKNLDEWRSTWRKISPPPEQPLSDFVTAVGARCPRPCTLEQALFEMQEYQQRNTIAHSQIDEWIAEASADKDPKSEKWRAVCQYILRDQQYIQDNVNLPAHIAGKERWLWESLEIFMHSHFKIATAMYDENGALMPKEVVPSDIYFRQPVDSSIDPGIKARVLAFKPFDRYERRLVKAYLKAEEKLRRLEAEHKTAQEDLSKKAKALRKAKADLAQEQNRFVTNERWIVDHPQEDYEIEGDTENESEVGVGEDSEGD
jgi:hypothetical protein